MPNVALVRGTGPTYTAGANGIASLIPEDVTREILQGAIVKSAVMNMFPHVRMSAKEQRMPVLAAFPIAGFVNGDTGMKATTDMTWQNKFLEAEEIAVIVAIPEQVLDDTPYDLWGEIRPRLEEAIAKTLDAAVLFGANKPASWPTAIVPAAIAAGNAIVQGAVGGNDIADDINLVMAALEADGFDVNGFLIRNSMKADLRGLRTTTKEFVFLPDNASALSNGVYQGTLFGEKAVASKSGVFEAQTGGQKTKLIAGDWSQGILGIRQDINVQMFREGVLQDTVTGAITHNLMQQDMVALRMTIRLAWQVPNPINQLQPTEASRYPFSILRDAT